MENAEAQGTAAGANARNIEDDTCTSMQLQGPPDRQWEDDRKQTDGGDIAMDLLAAYLWGPLSVAVDSGEHTRSDEFLQNVSLLSQQVTDLDAELSSSKDVQGKIAMDCTVAPERDNSPVQIFPCVRNPAPEQHSLKECNFLADSSADHHQRHRDVGTVSEKMSETVGCSSHAIAYRDTAEYARNLVVFPPVTREALLDALPIASLDIDKEKELQDRALAVFSSVLKTVATKSSDLMSRAEEFFAYSVVFADSDGSRCFVNAIFREIIDSIERRLKTIEDYVRVAYVEAKEIPGANTSNKEEKKQEAGIATSEAVMEREAPMNRGKSHANVTGSYRLPSFREATCNFQRKKRLMEMANAEWSIMVSKYLKLRKFCALGSVYTYKITLSCSIVLNALISVVNMVRPALESASVLREAFSLVGECQTKGLASSAFLTLHDIKVSTELAFLALTNAEAIMKLHGAVILHLKDSQKQLDSMMCDEAKVGNIMHLRNRFQEYLLGHADYPGRVSNSDIRQRETEAAFIINMMSQIVEEVNKGSSRILNLSEKSSSAVLDVLRALNAATDRSCSAIESSLDCFKQKLANQGN